MPKRPPRPSASKPAAPPPEWLRPLLLAMTGLLLLACFSTPFEDNDAWWHLRMGQYIVQQHKLPNPDPFAYTTYLRPDAYRGEALTRYFNLTHEWLAQATIYLAYAIGGFPLVVFLRVLMFALVSAITGYIVWKRRDDIYFAVLAALLSTAVTYQYAADRPFAVTLMFFAATIALLDSGRRRWLLLPLFLVWANCHGGVLMGWAAMGCYCLEALWLRWKGRPVARDTELFAACGASLLVSGLNPNGFNVLRTLIYYRGSAIEATLAEWQHTQLWPLTPFTVVAALAGITLLFAGRKARPADWLLYVLFAAAGVYVFRNILFMAVVGPMIIAGDLPWKPRVMPAVAGYALAGVIALATILRMSQGQSFQFSASEMTRPAGAANFLLSRNFRGRFYNNYEHGGYLMWRMWPAERVFIDSRALAENVFQDYRRITYNVADQTGTAFQLLDRYGVDAILITGYEYYTGSPHLLITALADPKQNVWKLVYQDGQAMVFMRQPPEGVRPLPNLAAMTAMEAECAEHIRLVPDQPFCARGTAQLYDRMGEVARARQWMAIYLEKKKEPDVAAEQEYGRLLMK